jgi:hypothetical protein
MSFQAYIDNVRAKTGKTPDQLKAAAVKATALVDWLAAAFELGRGHSMAIWAVWKSKGWVEAPKRKK